MKRDHQIFSGTAHLSTGQLLAYLRHGLEKKELHDVERHLSDCELCSDALEGLKKLDSDSSMMRITGELQKMARKRLSSRKKIFSQMELISVITVVFLIIFLIVIALLFFWKR